MIIKVSQTSSNIKQTYDIESENFYFRGESGSISRLQNVVMSGKDLVIEGVYDIVKLKENIPFGHLFGKENITRCFCIKYNEEKYGKIYFSKHGFMKSCYVVSPLEEEVLHCYSVSKGSFNYVCVYLGDKQIALIETYLCVNDYKYIHKIYLLDDYNKYAEILSFFTVYYSSYNFAERLRMNKGSVNQKAWTISRYNNKYDSVWRDTHFPNENFWGKISLFN